MKKTTDELQNEIRSIDYIDKYLISNKTELLDKTVSELLKKTIEDKNLNKAEVIRKSGLNEIYAYQILAGKKMPSRDKVIAFCFGMQLDVDETQLLLKHANYPILYVRQPRDSVIIYCIENKMSAIECNNTLYDNGFEII